MQRSAGSLPQTTVGGGLAGGSRGPAEVSEGSGQWLQGVPGVPKSVARLPAGGCSLTDGGRHFAAREGRVIVLVAAIHGCWV